MPPDLPPLHRDLTFLSPLSEQRAGRLVAWLADGLRDGGTVLDVGCGWAELLLRVAEAAPACTAVGIDLDEDSLAEAAGRAERRGLADRVRLLGGDGALTGPTAVDALVSVGATHVWGPPAEENQPLAYGAALAAMRARVRRGGRVVYSDGIWSRPPTPAATAPLAGRDDEFVDLRTLCTIATDAGFAIAAVGEASLEEWDAFESGFGARYAAWLATHADDDPDAAAVRERAARQRSAYLDGYRGVLGMAYLQLLAV